MISGLAFASSMYLSKAQTSTPLNGTITSDTTWTQANSPYTLAGNVLVNNGVTVTIDSGVQVNLNSYYLEINGTLKARGVSSDKISLIGGSRQYPYYGIYFTPACNGWNEQTQSGCTIENAVFSSCELGIDNTVKVTDTDGAAMSIQGGSSMITGNTRCEIDVLSGSPTVSNNIEVAGINVYDASPQIYNNTITTQNNGNGISVKGLASTVISDNIVSGSFPTACILCGGDINGGGEATIEGNLLVNTNPTGAGMEIGDNSNYTIEDNTITGSPAITTGVGYVEDSLQLSIVQNNFEETSGYKFYWDSSENLNATYNWWGTTDQQTINQSIYDSKNNFNLGTVNFVPFLTAPNFQAPNLNTPTSNPSSSPTMTPIPTPEFPSAISFAIVVLVLTIVILIWRRRLAHA